jgi:cell division protein FtsL
LTKEETHRPKLVLPLLASLVATLTLVLFVATLVASNTLATEGGSTVDVNAEVLSLQNENANLEAQVASLTSVSRIYNEALARGYVQPDKVMYAAPTSPVALNR